MAQSQVIILTRYLVLCPPFSSPPLNPYVQGYFYRGWLEQWWSGPRLGFIPQIPSQGNINGIPILQSPPPVTPPSITPVTTPPVIIVPSGPFLGNNGITVSPSPTPPSITPGPISGACQNAGPAAHNPHCQSCPRGYQRDIYGNCVPVLLS